MILFELRAAILAALSDHGLDKPKTFVARVVRSVGERLSVQKIDAKDGADDANPIEVWPGVPGVSSDPTGGEQVVVTLVGQAQLPIVTHRNPPTSPTPTEEGPVPTYPLPVNVRHDALTSIRMLSRSAAGAKMYVGGLGTAPVALAPNLVTYLQALEACLAASDVVLEGLVGPTYTPLKTARLAAADNIATISATKLEAK